MKTQYWKTSVTRFLLAQTISLFGSSLVQYAIIWHITLSTSSGKMLTLSTLCGFVPQIVISFFAGTLIDRYDRKKIIILSDAVIALSTLLLLILFFMGYQHIGLLFAVLAIRSAGTGVQTPTVNALIPQLTPKEHLMKVNGINSTLNSLMMLLSPAVSGAILSVSTLETTLLIDVATAVIGICITATVLITAGQRVAAGSASYLQALQKGFLYLQKDRFVKRLLLFQLTVLFLISPSAFLTPLMVSRTFGGEVWRLTASEMTYSLGMVLGGALITTWGGFRNKLHTTLLAGCVYGVMMLGLSAAPTFLAYLVCNALIGVTSPCYNTPLTVTIQEKVSGEMQGRVFSFMQISSSCALPLGMLVFGPLADMYSIRALFMVCGLLVVLVTLLAFAKQSRRSA